MEQVTGEAWNFLCGKILNYGVEQSALIRKHPPWEWQPRANILSSLLLLQVEVKILTYINSKSWPTKQQTLIFMSRYSFATFRRLQ